MAFSFTTILTSCDQFNDLLVTLGIKDADDDDEEVFNPAPSLPIEPIIPIEPIEPIIPVDPNLPIYITKFWDVEEFIYFSSSPVSLFIGEDENSNITWEKLLSIIEEAEKNINLDISKTTLAIDDGIFNPRNDNDEPFDTGEKYIIKLILPEIATTIKSFGWENGGSFRSFESLEEIYGTSLTKLDNYTFLNSTIKTGYFESITEIGIQVFEGCEKLTDLYFPEVPPKFNLEGLQTPSLFQKQSPEGTDKIIIHVSNTDNYEEWKLLGKDYIYGIHSPTIEFQS
jgi:hypothetical protein